MSLLIPPMVQALIFGYAATYDLNHVTYAVLDQDHTAASRELLAGLDGSGVFERVADFSARATSSRRSTRAARCSSCRSTRNSSATSCPVSAPTVQLIADGRNSNTAGTAMGYFADIVDQFNSSWGRDSRCRGGARAARRSCLVQPQSRDTLVHDSRHDRHVDPAPDHDAHGDVGRPRARARHLRSTAGDALSAFEIMAGKALPSMVVGTIQAAGVLLVAQLWFQSPLSART